MPVEYQHKPVTASDPGKLSRIAKQIADRELSPVDLVQGYLSRIDAVDAEVRTWRELGRLREQPLNANQDAEIFLWPAALWGAPKGLQPPGNGCARVSLGTGIVLGLRGKPI